MSLPYRLGSSSMFSRPNEDTITPKRVIFLSVEGTDTEVQYFNYIEQYKDQLGIDAIVHVEVLRKHDTNSDPASVLGLLDEYIQLREVGKFDEILSNFQLADYDSNFIKMYLNNPSKLTQRQRDQFKAVLNKEHVDLVYLDFLNKYHGESDVF